MDIFKKFTLLTFSLVAITALADAPGDEVDSADSNDDVVETTVASEETASSSAGMQTAVDAGDGDVENVVVTGSKFEISQYKTSQPVTIISGEEIQRRRKMSLQKSNLPKWISFFSSTYEISLL